MESVNFSPKNVPEFVPIGRGKMDVLDDFLLKASETLQKKDKPLPFPI